MSIGWGEIIINEFFILRADSTHIPQYVELYNNSDSLIDLTNWTITTLDGDGDYISGSQFDDSGLGIQPYNIDPFGYFLISSSYCNYSNFNCLFYNGYQSDIVFQLLLLPFDDPYFQGRLIDKGSVILTDNNNAVVDSIDYDIATGWPVGENSRGHSLALQSADLDNSYPENWSLSPESAISPYLYETGSEVLNFGTPRETNSFTDGCTDPEACNYDETANVDDGSCEYAEENYDYDGNCIAGVDCNSVCGGNTFDTDSCTGCMDNGYQQWSPNIGFTACNYEQFAIIQGECLYNDCAGECGGLAEVDECDVCGGDNTSCQQLGDINGDGTINVLDIVSLVNIIMDDGEYTEYGDVNDDGYLNILDVVTLVNWVLYGDDGACIDIDGNVYLTIK